MTGRFIAAIFLLAVAVGYGFRWLKNLNFLRNNNWDFDAQERQSPNLSVKTPDTGKQVSRKTRFYVNDPLVFVFSILMAVAVIFAEGI
jgi:hypothetical protein